MKGQLEKLTGRPLPENVAAELDSWCGHAEKLTVFQGATLIELVLPATELPQLRKALKRVEDRYDVVFGS